MTASSNGRTSERVATVPPSANSLTALDEMPHNLRRMVWEAPIRISPLALAAVALADGEKAAIELMKRNLRDELAAFARMYKAVHGSDLPHVAAGATPQTYGLVRRKQAAVSAWTKYRIRRAAKG